MNPLGLLIFALCVIIPIAWHFYREGRYRNPATRWPEVAKDLGFAFTAQPQATLQGAWKGRTMTWRGAGETASLSTPLGRSAGTVLIGPRAAAEKAAGIVVPDRVDFPGAQDAGFNERFLVRATPTELGEAAADATVRKILMSLPEVWIEAKEGSFLMRLTVAPTEAEHCREAMDVAVSICDILERR